MSVSTIPRGTFTSRHDFVKMTINSLILDSSIRADCEVFGLFRDIIPVEALNGEEGLRFGRGRQGLLPDSRLELSGQSGGVGALGHVVKTKQNKRAQILSEYRRTQSTAAKRANCLLVRLAKVREAHRGTARRRIAF